MWCLWCYNLFRIKWMVLKALRRHQKEIMTGICVSVWSMGYLRDVPFLKMNVGVGGATEPFFWEGGRYLPLHFNFFTPCHIPAHFKFIITLRTTLCNHLLPHLELFNTPTPALQIIFRASPPPTPYLWTWKPLDNRDIVSEHLIIFLAWRFATLCYYLTYISMWMRVD